MRCPAARRAARVAGRSLLVWAVLGLITWLDSDGCLFALRHAAPLNTAAVFSFIVTGFQAIAGFLSTAADVAVSYLSAAVSWLSTKVATMLTSTGAMFAKSWDALKIVWSDAVKPAFQWIDTQITRLQTWLKTTLQPVFNFLKAVRDEVLSLYKRFVQPIIDTIEFLRQLDRVLIAFHIHLLDKLDSVLAQIEYRIEEPILWLNAQLSKIFNALDLVMTLDGFFQRVTLVRSLARYAPDWLRVATNARMSPLDADASYAIEAHSAPQNSSELVDQMVAYLSGDQNDTGDAIDAAVSRALDFLTTT